MNAFPPAVPPQQLAIPAVRGEQFRANRPLGSIISHWSLKFNGTSNDLPVDEFLFRVETLAFADNIPLETLARCLHMMLGGMATHFYWLFQGQNPAATWIQLRQALTDQFKTNESDFEIRKSLYDRIQHAQESFSVFSLAVQGLASRLINPIPGVKLLPQHELPSSIRVTDATH